MGLRKIISLFFLITIFCLQAKAASFNVPAFTGKIINHSLLPLSNFQVEYNFSCGYRMYAGAPTAYCGSKEYVAKISEDGTFSVPEMKIDVDMGEDKGRYKPFLSTYATLSVSEEAQGYPFGFALDGVLATFDFKDKYNPAKDEAAKTFSIFQLDEQKLYFKLASGADPVQWLQSVGRDLSSTFTFDFTNGQLNENETGSLFSVYLQRNPFEHSNWAKFSKRLLMVAGKWDPNAMVKLNTLNPDLESSSVSFPFNSILPDFARTIRIDDTDYKDPSALRMISGDWKDGLISLGYEYGGKVEAIDRMNYFSARLGCNGSELSGEFVFRDSQLFPGNMLLRVPVNGGCNGESGSFTFLLKLKSGKKLELTAQITKVLAFEKGNHRMSVMASSDISDYDRKTGSEVSTQMVLRDQAGKVHGTIYLAR